MQVIVIKMLYKREKERIRSKVAHLRLLLITLSIDFFIIGIVFCNTVGKKSFYAFVILEDIQLEQGKKGTLNFLIKQKLRKTLINHGLMNLFFGPLSAWISLRKTTQRSSRQKSELIKYLYRVCHIFRILSFHYLPL